MDRPLDLDPTSRQPGESQHAEERERLRKVFDRGLDKPTGFVLPVQRWNTAPAKAAR